MVLVLVRETVKKSLCRALQGSGGGVRRNTTGNIGFQCVICEAVISGGVNHMRLITWWGNTRCVHPRVERRIALQRGRRTQSAGGAVRREWLVRYDRMQIR